MKGFFDSYFEKTQNCYGCKLDKNCISPYMSPKGRGLKELMVIAEAPGKKEDEIGEQLVGKIGKYFSGILKERDYILNRDFIKLNAVNCRPPNNRTPTSHEIAYCRPMVWNAIDKYKPKKILLLGKSALESFLGDRWQEGLGPINRWRGIIIPDRKANAWIMTTFHPSYVQRWLGSKEYGNTKSNDKNLRLLRGVESLFLKDIERFLYWTEDINSVMRDEKNSVTILNEFDSINLMKGLLNKERIISFDFETSGLKPHSKGHYIYICSICHNTDRSYSFEVTTNNSIYLKKIMADKKIKKIAYNAPFENLWSNVILGAPVNNWHFDAAIAAHIIDNRRDICSLEFQSYINFGLINFKDSTREFLKSSDKKNSNSFNRIRECNKYELLLRCGIDSLVTYRLYKEWSFLKKNPAYKLFHEGSQGLMECEYNGIRIDINYLNKQNKILIKEIIDIEDGIKNTKEGKTWEKIYGIKTNYDSPDQLRDVLYNNLKYKTDKLTSKGNAKVDKDTIEELNIPFIRKYILPLRKLKKAKSTYIEPLIRESVQENELRIIHNLFSLIIPTTYRSSSSHINFQNIPVRDPEVKKLIRTAFIPRPGRILGEFDFKGIEVAVACCYHKDPMMIEYIKDKSKDMHRDMAMQCFMLKKDQVSKMARYSAKSYFVFAQFYGDYYGNCAQYLWDGIKKHNLETTDGMPLKLHLKKRGIKSFNDFLDHIKDVEYDFWNNRFHIYKKWKDSHIKEFDKYGEMTSLLEFSFGGPLKKNEIINYPVQGTAFHVLLKTLSMVKKFLKKEKMSSLLVGQIHDSMVMDIVKEELKEIVKYVNYLLTDYLPKIWSWIIVPLNIEIELTPINGSWYEKKEEDIERILI